MTDDDRPLVSVLLPTRDRLQYLRYAIETVLRQDDPDWEILVSDNDSGEDIAGHVASLGDDRIRYVRTDAFVPVTENWNTALRHATGRYVVMLGDDDGLMPGYVSSLRELTGRFGEPDLVYQSAWLFSYPGVDPAEPDGFLEAHGYAEFLRNRTEPFVLPPATARKMVARAMRFRLRYGFNMQFSTVHRRLVERLAPAGDFYQSAFPDYYATNVAFLTATKIVVTPEPLVMIGVTPKSYGFFHRNEQEQAGKAFLGGAPDTVDEGPVRLEQMPGTNINTGWLSAVDTIWARHRAVAPASPGHARFRLLQAVHVLHGHYLRGSVPAEDVRALDRHLHSWERLLGHTLARTSAALGPRLPARLSQAIHNAFFGLVLGQFISWDPPRTRGGYRTMVDVFDQPPPPPPPVAHPLVERFRSTRV